MLAGQYVGDGVAGLRAQEPGREHGVGALEQPRQGERPAMAQDSNRRLASRERGLGQRTLPAGQVDPAAAVRLAGDFLGFAEA